jgi:hypothetical protein
MGSGNLWSHIGMGSLSTHRKRNIFPRIVQLLPSGSWESVYRGELFIIQIYGQCVANYQQNLIGAFFGCIYSGPVCDLYVSVVTKRNGGYFTPEYRLYLMIIPLIFGPLGLLMWGIGLGDRLHWAVPAVGSGISTAVLCAVPNIGMTYVVDSYRPVAGEAMTGLTAFKNTVAFGFSFGVIPWIQRNGLSQVSIQFPEEKIHSDLWNPGFWVSDTYRRCAFPSNNSFVSIWRTVEALDWQI